MKTLILLRHAKSSWDQPGLADFERPLAPRGRRNAPVMAERLARCDFRPQVIITSPARRARETAEAFARTLSMDASAIRYEPRIYEAGSSTLNAIVSEADDQWSRIMLVGHNPGLTQFAASLTGNGPGHMPTCAWVVLGLEIDSWAETGPGLANLLRYDYPKNPSAG